MNAEGFRIALTIAYGLLVTVGSLITWIYLQDHAALKKTQEQRTLMAQQLLTLQAQVTTISSQLVEAANKLTILDRCVDDRFSALTAQWLPLMQQLGSMGEAQHHLDAQFNVQRAEAARMHSENRENLRDLTQRLDTMTRRPS